MTSQLLEKDTVKHAFVRQATMETEASENQSTLSLETVTLNGELRLKSAASA